MTTKCMSTIILSKQWWTRLANHIHLHTPRKQVQHWMKRWMHTRLPSILISMCSIVNESISKLIPIHFQMRHCGGGRSRHRQTHDLAVCRTREFAKLLEWTMEIPMGTDWCFKKPSNLDWKNWCACALLWKRKFAVANEQGRGNSGGIYGTL